ncbi:MAG: ATP-binding protein [Defluviitaleaceae bacterium]|nr:ATP-binding protein [Defluviitaleaceae bacterium]
MYYIHDILSATYEDKLKSELHSQEKEYYFAQCQLMQESVEKMKTYRHDVKMHLSAILGFAAKDQTQDITHYVSHLLGDIDIIDIYCNTGNIAFDSIINFKLKTAAEQNIKTDISVFVPPALNIDVVDIVTILGNLLDNALDAVEKTADKIINLSVKVSKGNLFIKVDNSFDGEVKYAKGKAGTPEAIVTRKDGDNHGYGLKNVRRAAEKYHGHVDINHDGGVFCVQVLLYANGGAGR